MNIRPVTLEGRFVRLEPLRREHTDRLIEIGVGFGIFRWYPMAVDNAEDMRRYVAYSLGEAERGALVPFVTVERASNQIVGATNFMAIDRPNRRLEIGGTWLGVPWQRTPCNTEAKYLQLTHCFEDLGCVRVEFKTDSLNQASRAALARIGAVEEGTLRNHMICPGNRLRHSVYFSILDSEWPAVKQGLEKRLQSSPS